jgi:hypothetical protein
MGGFVIKGNKRWWLILGLPVFIIYIFLTPRPIPEETILTPRWITSLELNYPINLNNFSAQRAGELLPFILGDRFGYVGDDGIFAINQIRSAYISISEKNWAEYGSLPSSIQVMNPHNQPVLVISDPKGYPLFLDNRLFIIGSEQNSITALGPAAEALWSFDFPAPITCIDAANGYVLAGTLDGMMILLNSRGVPVFVPFEPGGSRLPVILGCAISRDASRLALIAGIDNQRFLLLERAANTYRVVYHEFLTSGFRRPVHINFVDNDTRVVFEREGGLGIFATNSRASTSISLDGEIVSVDSSKDGDFLFLITSQGAKEKRLVTIRFPGLVISEVPFNSENTFLARRGDMLYLAGDQTMASFELERR